MWVNGEVWQDDMFLCMMFLICCEIEYILIFMILQFGDIIVMGMFIGVGVWFDLLCYLVFGDVVEVEVNMIGILCNIVEDEVV